MKFTEKLARKKSLGEREKERSGNLKKGKKSDVFFFFNVGQSK